MVEILCDGLDKKVEGLSNHSQSPRNYADYLQDLITFQFNRVLLITLLDSIKRGLGPLFMCSQLIRAKSVRHINHPLEGEIHGTHKEHQCSSLHRKRNQCLRHNITHPPISSTIFISL